MTILCEMSVYKNQREQKIPFPHTIHYDREVGVLLLGTDFGHVARLKSTIETLKKEILP